MLLPLYCATYYHDAAAAAAAAAIAAATTPTEALYYAPLRVPIAGAKRLAREVDAAGLGQVEVRG